MTVATLSHVICDAVRWTCTPSVVCSGVDRVSSEFRLGDVPPALRVPEAAPASSDEEERHVRFRIPPNEDVEQALVSSAADEQGQPVEAKVKECEEADVPGEETDDDLRS